MGACLAAAGAVALSRKRSAIARAAENKPAEVTPGKKPWREPQLVFQQGFEYLTPVPGSEKMLGTMVGADVETGGEIWDPMGFAKLYDRNFDFNNVMVYPHVQWLREAELKHGRVCMLAFVGMVVQQWYQIPGLPQQPDWIKALDECYASPVAQLGLVQISVFAMVVEGNSNPSLAWIGEMDREPGDLGFDPLKFSKRPGFDLKKKQLIELKNGRLAMIGVASMAANHVLPGSVPFLTGAYATRPEANPLATSSTLCGQTGSITPVQAPSKTAARYTTQVVLPSLQWIKVGLKSADLQPTELKAKNLAGVDILVGKDGGGKLFCVGNLCPHIGTPMSEGADVIGDVIVCPLHGSSFKVTTGELIDWCPSPPIIGPLTGLPIEKKNLAVFDIREAGIFGGGDLEVLVDTNAKKAWEADYWKGVLDAQGKDDGSYY
jgi:nitrite reductase/ring-hydroxylating ferredoxin subunit